MSAGELIGVNVTGAVGTASTGTSRTLHQVLNEAPTSKFHRRAVVVSGVGFFTDAYDLFVISTVAALVTLQ